MKPVTPDDIVGNLSFIKGGKNVAIFKNINWQAVIEKSTANNTFLLSPTSPFSSLPIGDPVFGFV